MRTGEREKRAAALEDLRRIALLVEYEGTGYHGFQLQKNARSVQGELEDALFHLTGERRRIKGAGRTDAGVHAQGQVVAFDTWASYAPAVFLQALNHYLPEDISVKEARLVSLDFDPRRWASAREYRYQILTSTTPSPLLRRFAYLVRQPLNVEAMREAARLLEGEMDFAPFSGPLTSEKGTTRRRVYRCSVDIKNELITLTMAANGFLPQQVRRTAGALLEVGLGRLSLQRFQALAECGVRGAFTRTLPAKGLFLVKVDYPDGLFSQRERVAGEHTTLEAGAR